MHYNSYSRIYTQNTNQGTEVMLGVHRVFREFFFFIYKVEEMESQNLFGDMNENCMNKNQ